MPSEPPEWLRAVVSELPARGHATSANLEYPHSLGAGPCCNSCQVPKLLWRGGSSGGMTSGAEPGEVHLAG